MHITFTALNIHGMSLDKLATKLSASRYSLPHGCDGQLLHSVERHLALGAVCSGRSIIKKTE